MRNYEQYKRMVKFLFSIIVLSLEAAAFWYVWLHFYNQKMETPYNRSGHWLMVAVYGIFLVLFNILYGGLKVGYLRTGNMIYSQFLAALCANIMAYLQITLLTKSFQNLIPLLAMTCIQFLMVCIWSFLSTRFYRFLYPSRNVLLVYGEHPVANLMGKIHTRNDRFAIGEIVHISAGIREIKRKIDQYEGVVICDIPSSMRNVILKYSYEKSIRTYTTPKISDVIIKSSESLHLFDTPLLLSRNNGLSFDQRFVKRGVDLVLSLAALLFLSPVFMVTAAAIKLYDGGPVFYVQERCTKGGRVFRIYKFRSMIVDAEKEGHSIPAAEQDPRITPVGRIIRASRVDELPQVFNILKGDMSIVGPRPERVEHVELYTKQIPEFGYRMKVKGGLTGYAQVYGKYNTTAYDKLKLDLMYIQNYSLLLDIEIIFKTVKILFMKESTEGFGMEDAAAIAQGCGEGTETVRSCFGKRESDTESADKRQYERNRL
ncbi:exopolysaccharide biosynthesis polyprenyl glycosylphosphotransferase [bacterium D16-54]|nr:exopolysaccharide biosynthesis polyprenyl glycosylphosphotransferase [bacterium D16-54]RKJ10013.1 exopolysaccharide biosynthesis polyprenyl glycosylphosphotransferase [bacterium D16-56]